MSGIQIQNLGPQAVSAHLDYSDNVYTQDFSTPGSTPACVPVDRDLPVPGNGSETVLLGAHDKAVDWSRDHGCTYIGSLTITSPDGTSIAALANQVAGDGSNDQLSTYNG